MFSSVVTRKSHESKIDTWIFTRRGAHLKNSWQSSKKRKHWTRRDVIHTCSGVFDFHFDTFIAETVKENSRSVLTARSSIVFSNGENKRSVQKISAYPAKQAPNIWDEKVSSKTAPVQNPCYTWTCCSGSNFQQPASTCVWKIEKPIRCTIKPILDGAIFRNNGRRPDEYHW